MIFLSFALLIAAAEPQPDDGAAVAAACGGEVQHDDFVKLPKAQQTKKLSCFSREAAKRYNLTLPSRIDDATVLQSVSANGTALTYHYTVNLLREELRPGALEAFKPKVKAKVCAAHDMSMIVSVGGAYVYEWSDRAGKLIGRLLVDRC